MSENQDVDRRSVLKVAGVAAAGAVVASSGCVATGRGKSPRFNNTEFYDAENKFDEEKAKDAVMKMCEHHGYPIFPNMRDQLWVSDYGAGQFATMGLAAIMFINNVEDRYMMLDIFLLPNQMLPEHWHLEAEDNPAKMEGWLVRWGVSHIVGIGEPNLGEDVVIPKCHWNGKATTEHEVVGTPGTFVKLAKVESRHWQYGGPDGAIVTEVANVHTNSGVRHTDPKLDDFFLKMVGAK